MPATSSGRITKARKGKNLTPHQKNHRWESFTTKIGKLHSLDPLRKVRRHDLEAEDLKASTSYFRNGLEKWNELNIATGFISFKRGALPISESLAQILHHEEKIMDLLAQHISMQQKESLEPLLDLLTALAHDLGVRFEKHYARSLDLIVAIAGKHQDVEVIEWTFAALAFLFKYLSRLITPNLQPTYDVLAPLFGKTRHPQYIARFAAEATSFLIKKAAAPTHRETALTSIVQHARDDLASIRGERQFQLYQDGIMTMFAESIKGSGETIHSTGPSILRALLRAIPEQELGLTVEPDWTNVICGVLTAVIHHSNPTTFTPLLETLVEEAQARIEEEVDGKPWRLTPLIKILSTAAGVRAGVRVTDWTALVRTFVSMVDVTAKAALEVSTLESSLIWRDIIISAAIVWHHAPVDALIPRINEFTTALQRNSLMRWFIPFCAYFSELDAQRFRSLFQGYFQRFIVTHWSDGHNDDELCIFLPKMVKSRSLPAPGDQETLNLPRSWQDQIVAKFERLEVSPFPERGTYDKDPQTWRDRCLPKYSILLDLLNSTTVHPSATARIADLLLRKLKLALRPTSTLASDEVHFSVSQGFHAYLRMSKAAGPVDPSLHPLLQAALPRFSRSVGFLQAYCDYVLETKASPGVDRQESSSSEDDSTSGEDPVTRALVDNLSSPSHDLRLATLKILQQLQSTPDEHSLLSLMTDVEETPLGIETMRTIGMHLRKIGLTYASLTEGSWLRQAVPNFLFGMMTLKLTPLWNDATEALKQVSETKSGEEIITTLALEWLTVPSMRGSGPGGPPPARNNSGLTNFDCTNIQRLQGQADAIQQVVDKALDMMLESFDKQQESVEIRPANARSQALKVLNALPALAEKRSRKLVPFFLSWAEDTPEADEGQEDTEASLEGQTWSLFDRKALLSVFNQFVNPRSLYESQRVYNGLLHLMENGDIEVQKSTLKALLGWKQEGVKPYQENLEYLLDEARFKNELTVLMQGEQTIQPEHRAELMPILLRLLYGRTISKKGAASGRHGLQATRLAVLRNLSQEDMGSFLDIAVGKLRDVCVIDENGLQESVISRELLPPRKQVGFMNMMMPLVNELGADVEPYVDTLLNAVLYCLIYSCRKLREIADEAEADSDEEGKEATHESLMKVTRTAGLKCIIALFRNAPDFAWDRFASTIITEVVSPRIPNLPQENTQGVSGLLQLLSIWSQLPKAAMYLAMNKDIVPKIIECVSMERSKDEVKVFCLTIVRNLIKLASASAIDSEFNELIKVELLDPSTDLLLRNVAVALKSEGISGSFLEACLETVVEISPLVETSENVQEILQISTFLLNQPAKKVSPRAKGQILLILEQFVTLHEANGVDLSPSTKLFTGIFETVSALFSYFKDRDNRQTACRLLAILAQKDASLQQAAKICASLNSFVEDRLDEPDYDKRLTGFNEISGKQAPLDNRQWLPLLHNLTFYLGNDEEYGVLSSNAADALRAFIRDAAEAIDEVLQRAFHVQLEKIVVPALYTGARDVSATVRRECLRVFGFLLSRMPTWSGVSDLKALLTDTDEESSEPAFFFNILSPATSRQLEALQMLETANETSQFSSQNLYHFFIPILEHFVVGKADNSDDKGLGAQAATTIGALSASLEWKHFRVVLQRYISFVDSKPDLQKQVNRLLGKVADTLVSVTQSVYGEDTMEAEKADGSSVSKHLHESLPLQEKLSTDMVNNYLPSLLKHLNHKDDSEVSHRVPVGVIIVKLLTILPEDVMSLKLAGVLTDICHILRSKNSESRDMARETLSSIATILGPTHFGFILKELSSALRRGYQLHVFSYTLHSILLQVIPEFEQGSLDYCLPAIVTVIIDDVFGVTGQEKDADGYTTQMKEVKSSKSQDSMELIAKTVSVSHLVDLIRPLQALLMQKVDLKLVCKIDVLLNRITTGLLQNPAAESRDTLIFCYEVIQDVYKAQKPEAEVRIDPRLKKYLYQKGVRKSERDAQTKHTYKLVKFALDILRSILKKHDSLRNEANLLGFIGIFGDAVVAGEEEVKIAAFKLLATLVKVPFDSDAGLGLYKVATKEAIKSLSYSSTTSSDLSQSALKLVSVVLRDKREIKVNPSAVEMLLGKLKDDLTEPLYRHVTFNFLRSLLESKIQTDVVYDTLDYVGTVMITNEDKDTRDLARGAFFQFLREYPQQKARWTQQLDFIVANLKYDREGGRLSVMEIIHLLLKKSLDEYVQEIVSTCFIPLVFVVANDDSEKCRLAAGELLKEIFRRADKERQRQFLDLLRSWLGQEDNDAVLSLGIQAFGFYFDSREPSVKDNKEVKLVHGKISEIIGAGDIKVADEGLVNNALAVAQILVQQYPALLLSEGSRDFWENVRGCLAHPEASVKLSTVKLLSAYLADFADQSAETGHKLQGSHGLVLGPSDIEDLVSLAVSTLRVQEIDDALAAEITQVIIFLAPRLKLRKQEAPSAEALGDNDEAEEEESRIDSGGKDLQYLFWKLSTILRQDVKRTSEGMTPKVVAMEVLETVCRRVPESHIEPSLKTILYPLQSIVDPNVSVPFSLDDGFKTKHEAVKNRAQILMESLQKKFGTATFTTQLLAIREEVKARRQARSTKRKIEAVANPEKHITDKRKKADKKKEKKKVRGQEYKAYRQSFKQW